MLRDQLRGVESISAAIDSGTSLSLLLVRKEGLSIGAERLAERARELGISVQPESERELRRMSAGEGAEEVLALIGPPIARDLDGLMRSKGIVFVLVGLRYPGNVGFILRSLEVAGCAGVVLDTDWGVGQRTEAMRVGMRANRFYPVIDGSSAEAVRAARRADRRLVALETSGKSAPWEIDLTDSIAVFVGSETIGIPGTLLSEADDIVGIPVGGFIPSYNVQAAVGIFLGEWMRQNV